MIWPNFGQTFVLHRTEPNIRSAMRAKHSVLPNFGPFLLIRIDYCSVVFAGLLAISLAPASGAMIRFVAGRRLTT